MSSVDVKLDGLSVMIGMPAGGMIPPMTAKSLVGSFLACQQMKIACQLGMITGCSIVTHARDEVLDLFLKSDANRLFWIDSDMVWEAGDFIRMLAMSKLREVVCATYTAKGDTPTFFINHDSSDSLHQQDYGLVEVKGVGLGFTVIHREPLVKLAESKPQVKDQVSGRSCAAVFRTGIVDGCRQGEDMAFFSDLRELGYKVWLDPEVCPGHFGTKLYTGSIKSAMKFD